MDPNAIEVFKWRICESRTASGEPRPRLLLVNPAILYSTQFFGVNTSASLTEPSSEVASRSEQVQESLAPFLATIEATDHKLHADIVQRDFDRPVLAVQLLNATSPKKAEIVQHQILRYKVLESLAWAAKDMNSNSIPIQQTPDFEIEVVDHEYINLGINNWEGTLQQFCDEMKQDHAPTTGTRLEPRDRVLSSLLAKIQESATSRYHSTVVSNMCGAALGVRALLAAGVSSRSTTDLGQDIASSSEVGPSNPSDLLKTLLAFDVQSSSASSEGILKYFGGKTDLHLLRALYAATACSPVVLLSTKQLVTRKQSSIPLHVLYSSLLQPWGVWTPLRIMVVHDLWAAILQLARYGGDDCLAMLDQLARKWRFMGASTPMMDRALNPYPDVYSQLAQHIKMANAFANAVITSFARSGLARKKRRNTDEVATDEAFEQDGDSSLRMALVWNLWETGLPVASTAKELGTFESFTKPLHPWAWNQRSVSAPPFPPTFDRAEDVRPWDAKDQVPEPRINLNEHPIWPFVKTDFHLLNPFQVEYDFGVEVHAKDEEGTRRSKRLTDKTTKEDDKNPTDTSKKKKRAGGGRRTGGTYRRSSARKEAAQSDTIKPKVEWEAKVEFEEKARDQHPVWSMKSRSEDDHIETSELGSIRIAMTESQETSIVFYKGMGVEYRNSRRIVQSISKQRPLTEQGAFNLRGSSIVKTYTRVEWDTLNSQEQRQAFAASGVIHVRGEPPFDILPDVKDLKSFEGLSRLVDLDRPLFCHDQLIVRPPGEGFEFRMRKSTLREFLDVSERNKDAINEGRLQDVSVLSYLDINLDGTVVCPPVATARLADGMCLDDDRPQLFSWTTPTPRNWRNWMLAMHSSATTVTHMDAAGLCTWVHIPVGEKLWFVGNHNIGGHKSAGDTLQQSLGKTGIFMDAKLEWTCIPLKAGDDLYMAPGIPHHVITTENSIATGGHFFSAAHYTRTLEAILVEHFSGDEATNTSHTDVHIVLFKILRKYCDAIDTNRSLPPAKDLASLILLCSVIDQLPPKVPESVHETVWQHSSKFAIDHGYVLRHIQKIRDVLQPADTYQKRRILRCMRSQWAACQKMYRWCAGHFGPTAVVRGKTKVALEVPDILADLLAPDGSLAQLLRQKHLDEGEKDLMEG